MLFTSPLFEGGYEQHSSTKEFDTVKERTLNVGTSKIETMARLSTCSKTRFEFSDNFVDVGDCVITEDGFNLLHVHIPSRLLPQIEADDFAP